MNRQTKITSAAAAVLVGAGVALGLLLGGGSSSAKPVQVQHVDQPIVVVTSTDTVSPAAAPSAVVSVTVSSNAPVLAPIQKVAPMTQPADLNSATPDQWGPTNNYVTNPAVIGNGDGVRPTPLLLPSAPTTDMMPSLPTPSR
jgi:hypothetical protein